jgi:hypothetical protein
LIGNLIAQNPAIFTQLIHVLENIQLNTLRVLKIQLLMHNFIQVDNTMR